MGLKVEGNFVECLYEGEGLIWRGLNMLYNLLYYFHLHYM